MYTRENWDTAHAWYEQEKTGFIKNHTGLYLLVNTETGKWSLGDPVKDPLNGGHVDACNNHLLQHGKLWGEYFGVRIPTA